MKLMQCPVATPTRTAVTEHRYHSMIVFNYEYSSGLEVDKKGSFLFETTATAGGISSKVKVKVTLVQALRLIGGASGLRPLAC